MSTNKYHVTKLTETRVFQVPHDALPSTLIVDVGSGAVVLEVQIDTDANQWLTAETFVTDGIHKVEANGCTVRVSVTGDAAYAFVRL